MKYLKKTNIETNGFALSRIGSGSMRMAGNMQESIATIHASLDAGINYLNTADFYGSGQSEMTICEALKGRKREDVFISVKFGMLLGVNGQMYGLDVRPQAVENYLNYTLKRLGTDYVDLYQPARIDPNIPVEDTIGAVADLVKKGYVRNIGISEVNGETLRKANAVHPISLVEVRYSMMDRHIEDDLLPVAHELGIGVVAFAVLLAGLIGGGSREQKLATMSGRMSAEALEDIKRNIALSDALQAMADEKGITLAQLAISWVLSQGDDILALVGSRTPAQVIDTVKAMDIKLTTEDLNRIGKIIPKEQATSSYMLDIKVDKNGLLIR